MNSVKVSQLFKRKVKPLAKKYHTLKDSIDDLGTRLLNNPYLGESYGKNIYKVRLADESKGRGKVAASEYCIIWLLNKVTIS